MLFCFRRLPPATGPSSVDLAWFPDAGEGEEWLRRGHLYDWLCGSAEAFQEELAQSGLLEAPSPDAPSSRSAGTALDPMDRGMAAPAALCCILLAVFAMFSWNYREFFGPDSVYYFARRLSSWQDILHAFGSVDDRGHYRPAGLFLFSYGLYPLLGENATAYHFIPLLFHAINVGLLYALVRRLAGSATAALCAAGFFALHRVNFYVTYGITFIPDFTGVFFLLLAFLCYLRRGGGRRWYTASFLFWISALLSKETAIVFPAMLAVYELLQAEGGRLGLRLRRLWKRTAPFWAASAGFIVLLTGLRGGALYPADPEHPYRATLSVSTLLPKLKYLWWSLNLPQGSGLTDVLGTTMGMPANPIELDFPLHTSISAVVLLPFMALFVYQAAVSVLRGSRLTVCGFSWFVLALLPVLPLIGKVMQHNLYFPLFGLALAFGLFARDLLQSRYRAAAAPLAVIFLLSTGIGVVNQRNNSWPVNASRLSQQYLTQFREASRGLPYCPTAVIVTRTSNPDSIWYTDGGNLFRVFGRCPSLQVYFEGLDQEPSGIPALRLELKDGL